MAARFKAKVERAGAVLERWLRNHGRDRDVRAYTIRHRWADLVGPQLSERTQPTSLRDGLLTVVVASAAWLNELTFMRGALVGRINELVGQGTVAAIRLVAGQVRPPPAPAPLEEQPAYVELPPHEVERVEREVAEQVDDPELREAILKARLAQLGRVLRYTD